MRLQHLVMISLGLCFASAAMAKDIAITGNNTSYAKNDVQKLAATAVKMGVKEPVNLQLSNGNLHISGSNATNCIIKVGTGSTPQIAGINCQ